MPIPSTPERHDRRDDGGTSAQARALAGARVRAMRRRARGIRLRVACGAAALFIAAFAGILIQMATGHDPALSANATRTKSALLASTSSAKTSRGQEAVHAAETKSASPRKAGDAKEQERETKAAAAAASRESSSAKKDSSSAKESSQTTNETSSDSPGTATGSKASNSSSDSSGSESSDGSSSSSSTESASSKSSSGTASAVTTSQS